MNQNAQCHRRLLSFLLNWEGGGVDYIDKKTTSVTVGSTENEYCGAIFDPARHFELEVSAAWRHGFSSDSSEHEPDLSDQYLLLETSEGSRDQKNERFAA